MFPSPFLAKVFSFRVRLSSPIMIGTFFLVSCLQASCLINSVSGQDRFAEVEKLFAEVEPSRLLIGLHKDDDQDAARRRISAAVISMGGRVEHSYQTIAAMAVEVPPESVGDLAALPDVRLVEKNGEFRVNAEEIPWGINRIRATQNPFRGLQDEKGGTGVVVAVLDTGIDWDHPDLAENIYTNPLELWGQPNVDDDGNGFVDDIRGWDFVNNDNNPYDDHWHGTHCAGTVGAVGDNRIGVVGVAPNVTLMPIKVLDSSGSGSFGDVIAAIEYCELMGVDITSNSYGGSQDAGSLVEAAFDAAKEAGVLHIAAAGNSGNSSGTGDSVEYPAKYDSVVGVAATTSSDGRASFSSTGPDVDLAAPGTGIRSTRRNGGYRNASGTSMACPHVAGAAAVLMSDGVADIDLVVIMLGMSAVDLGPTGDDNLFGMGRIDLYAARQLLGNLDKPGPIQTVAIETIEYGVANGRRDLTITIKAVQPYTDGSQLAVPEASVGITLLHVESNTSYTGTSTTNSVGEINFKLRSAPAGTYQTTINSVNAPPLNWDEVTPSNSFDF